MATQTSPGLLRGEAARDSRVDIAARRLGALYLAGTSAGKPLPGGWLDPAAFSPERNASLLKASEVYAPGSSLALLRDVYRDDVKVLADDVRTEAVAWALGVLGDQEPLLARLTQTVEREAPRLHRNAQAILSGSARTTIASGSGAVLSADEAAALRRTERGDRELVMDRFERARFTRLLREVGDDDLTTLLCHPDGVRILRSFATSQERGRTSALAALSSCRGAVATMAAALVQDHRLIWRLPPAIAAGTAARGLHRWPGALDFTLAWAAHAGRTPLERAIDVASNALMAIALAGGPYGDAVTFPLDVVLSLVSVAVTYARMAEQDRAAAATAFAGAGRLSEGGSALAVAFEGVVAMAAVIAPSKAIRRLRPSVIAPPAPVRTTPRVADPLPAAPASGRGGGGTSTGNRMTGDSQKGVAPAVDGTSRLPTRTPQEQIRIRRLKAIELINLDYALDMRHVEATVQQARRRLGLPPLVLRYNSAGFLRSPSHFWIAMADRYPKLFSAVNEARIRGRPFAAPHVDATWVRFHRGHQPYLGTELVHHHIEQGPWAAGLPAPVHKDLYAELHPVTNPRVTE